jgi:hypothetical protein
MMVGGPDIGQSIARFLSSLSGADQSCGLCTTRVLSADLRRAPCPGCTGALASYTASNQLSLCH